MGRTSKADQNWFSISNGSYQWQAGTDRVVSVNSLPDALVFVPETPQDWDACLKICDGTTNILWPAGFGLQVAQGQENAVDLNNKVSDCHITGDFGVGGGTGDQVLTVKGGCSNITFSGTIHSQGREAQVVVDAWADQCFDKSFNLDFSGLVNADGSPVTFILCRCENVKLPPNAKVLRWKTLCYQAYWIAKWCLVKVGVLGGSK